jgi:glycosyltransferase involved in cell wall biosynthesis
MNKLKVLQLGSPSGLYGAERWILALIKNLNPDLVESFVGTIIDIPGQHAPLCKEAEAAGFKTVAFEGAGRFNFTVVGLIRDFIRRNSIDILHTHGYKTDLVGIFSVMGTGCKIITTPHGWTKQPDLKLFCYEMADRFIFPFLDAVVPLSEALMGPLYRLPGLKKKLHYIQNGVDIKEIEDVTEVSNEMVSWKAEKVFIIGYIGRLTPGKGLEVLLKAVANNSTENWRVAIIGEGEQEQQLKSLCHELGIDAIVNFFGFRSDRIAFLKEFDAFVLPSRSEGIPRCLMEAMAANVPVVASDIPGCRYLVKDESTGLLFQVDNAEELATSLKKIINSPVLTESMTATAFNYVYSEYSANKMARDYTVLYSNLLCR